MKQTMVQDSSNYEMHLIIANWIISKEVYYFNLSPDNADGTEVDFWKMSDLPTLGIEAVFIGQRVQDSLTEF